MNVFWIIGLLAIGAFVGMILMAAVSVAHDPDDKDDRKGE
jgi:hypothetical protein